jgi:hypothetical protein
MIPEMSDLRSQFNEDHDTAQTNQNFKIRYQKTSDDTIATGASDYLRRMVTLNTSSTSYTLTWRNGGVKKRVGWGLKDTLSFAFFLELSVKAIRVFRPSAVLWVYRTKRGSLVDSLASLRRALPVGKRHRKGNNPWQPTTRTHRFHQSESFSCRHSSAPPISAALLSSLGAVIGTWRQLGSYCFLGCVHLLGKGGYCGTKEQLLG